MNVHIVDSSKKLKQCCWVFLVFYSKFFLVMKMMRVFCTVLLPVSAA